MIGFRVILVALVALVSFGCRPRPTKAPVAVAPQTVTSTAPAPPAFRSQKQALAIEQIRYKWVTVDWDQYFNEVKVELPYSDRYYFVEYRQTLNSPWTVVAITNKPPVRVYVPENMGFFRVGRNY